jgi:catechol 2,3-dioxygenase-like lactoylglutathione lyase family enzyme
MSSAVSAGVRATKLDHVSIIVTDVDRANAFYRDVLGLKEVPRPKSFDFPGAWFEVGAELIHLLGQTSADAPGRRHFCLFVEDVHAAADYLAGRGLKVTWDVKYKIDGIDRFFTNDPDGNRIEFQGTERTSA